MRRILHSMIMLAVVGLNLFAFQNCHQVGMQTQSLSSNSSEPASLEENQLVFPDDFHKMNLVPYAESSNPQIKNIQIEYNSPYVYETKASSHARTLCTKNCGDSFKVSGFLEDSDRNLVVSVNLNSSIRSASAKKSQIGYRMTNLADKKVSMIGLIHLGKKSTQVIKSTFRYNIDSGLLELPAGRYSLSVLVMDPLMSISFIQLSGSSDSQWKEVLRFSVSDQAEKSDDIQVVGSETEKGSTATCDNGAKNFPNCDNFPPCPNGALNPPTGSEMKSSCQICPVGKVMIDGLCAEPKSNVFAGLGQSLSTCESGSSSAVLKNGEIACYGYIDQGTSWGDDQWACKDSSGRTMSSCKISTSLCEAGIAEGQLLEMNNDQTIHLSRFSDDGSIVIKLVRQMLGQSSRSIDYSFSLGNFLAFWEYRCVGSSNSDPIVPVNPVQEVKETKVNELDKMVILAAMDFNEAEYLMLYDDVKKAVEQRHFTSGYQHYQLYGRSEMRSPSFLFDEEKNRQELAGVMSSKQSAWEYFQQQNRVNPSWIPKHMHFDSQSYLETHRDVAIAIKDGRLQSALQHYIIYGRNEGRKIHLNNCFKNVSRCVVNDVVVVAIPQGQGRSCQWGSKVIANGDGILAYQALRPGAGQNCASEKRVCRDGDLSGSFSFSTCYQEPELPNIDCEVRGVPVPHGQKITVFSSSTVMPGESCKSQVRVCNNGSMSGEWEFTYHSCSVSQYKSCDFNHEVVPHGQSVTAYKQKWNASKCSSEKRVCLNGTLSGSYNFSSCLSYDPLPNLADDLELKKMIGKAAAEFNEREYLLLYPDVDDAVKKGIYHSGFEHYQKFGRNEKRSPSFFLNEAKSFEAFKPYLKGNQNVLDYFKENSGKKSFYDTPYTHFSEYKYLRFHKDVAAAVKIKKYSSGMMHYLKVGRSEGRQLFIEP